jgi:hypothetical protein
LIFFMTFKFSSSIQMFLLPSFSLFRRRRQADFRHRPLPPRVRQVHRVWWHAGHQTVPEGRWRIRVLLRVALGTVRGGSRRGQFIGKLPYYAFTLLLFIVILVFEFASIFVVSFCSVLPSHLKIESGRLLQGITVDSVLRSRHG